RGGQETKRRSRCQLPYGSGRCIVALQFSREPLQEYRYILPVPAPRMALQTIPPTPSWFAPQNDGPPNLANLLATIRYTSRRNGTTRSGTRSSRSHRQASNSAGCPLRGVSGSISSSEPLKRNANHFCRWPRNFARRWEGGTANGGNS